MPRLSLAFFTAAAFCGLGGVIMGTVMGATQDFTQSPVHAHLNLIGWASLAIMGAFYALAGDGGRAGWVNFWLMVAGLALLTPGLAISLANGHAVNAGMIAGPVFVVLGMLTFVGVVLSHWRKPAGV